MLRSVRHWAAAAALTVIVAASAWAANTIEGKWTWTQMGPNGDVAITLELKQEGEKLTGTMTRNNMPTEIKEGTIKGSDLSFISVRERNGQEFKTVYKGKLDADAGKITGTITTNRNGNEQTREWTATRAK
jgi:hypothetical protein